MAMSSFSKIGSDIDDYRVVGTPDDGHNLGAVPADVALAEKTPMTFRQLRVLAATEAEAVEALSKVGQLIWLTDRIPQPFEGTWFEAMVLCEEVAG